MCQRTTTAPGALLGVMLKEEEGKRSAVVSCRDWNINQNLNADLYSFLNYNYDTVSLSILLPLSYWALFLKMFFWFSGIL